MSALAGFGLACGVAAGSLLVYGLVSGYLEDKRLREWVAEQDRIDAEAEHRALEEVASSLHALREFYERFPYAPTGDIDLDTVAELEDLMAMPAVTPPHELH